MGIAFASGQIQVSGFKDSGTVGYDSTPGDLPQYFVVDFSKSWATNAWVGYTVWITGGPGAGQTGLITSNDANVLYINQQWPVGTDTTSTYAILYRASDVVAAVPAYATLNATTNLVQFSAPINVLSGGGLSLFREIWQFTTTGQGLNVSAGGYFHAGAQADTRFWPERGVDGGGIYCSKTTTSAFTMSWAGSVRVYGTSLHLYCTQAAGAATAGINVASGSATGVRLYDCSISGMTLGVWGNDTFVGCVMHQHPGNDTNFLFNAAPARFVGNVGTVALGAVTGVDCVDVATVAPYGTSQPRDILVSGIGSMYCWNMSLTWALPSSSGTGYTGIKYASVPTYVSTIYFGVLVGVTTKDAAGNPVAAAVGVTTASGGGAIVTSRSGGPVMSAAVSTDGTTGAYTGCVGTGEGLPIILAKATGVSQYSSSVTVYGPFSMMVRAYGYQFQAAQKTWSGRATELVTLIANPYTVASAAVAAAYSGISVSGTTRTLTVSGTRSLQEVYDYCEWWAAQPGNLLYAEPLVASGNGNFSSTYNLIVSGTLTGTGSLNLGGNAFTLSGGGSVSATLPVTYSGGTYTALTVTGLPEATEVRIRQGSYTLDHVQSQSGGSYSYRYTAASDLSVSVQCSCPGYQIEPIQTTLSTTAKTIQATVAPDPSYTTA